MKMICPCCGEELSIEDKMAMIQDIVVSAKDAIEKNEFTAHDLAETILFIEQLSDSSDRPARVH